MNENALGNDDLLNEKILGEKIQAWMIQNKQTLSLAESCTGGAIAASLTKIPGASQYFLGSLVTYSNALKSNLLDVPKELIEKHGAVSQEVSLAMVKGLLNKTKSDYGIAVTGIAGPEGGSAQKPVGTVWIAFFKRDSAPQAFKIHAKGSRSNVIEETVNEALKFLWNKIKSSD